VKPSTGAGVVASILPASGAERERGERELEANGIRLPMMYRAVAGAAFGGSGIPLLVVRDPRSGPVAAMALVVRRKLPPTGLRTVYVPYFGQAIADGATDAAIDALIALVGRRPQVLRLSVALFEPDPTRAAGVRQALQQRGFHRALLQNAYERTLRLDLGADEAALLAGLHASARRNIREVAKRPVRVAPVTDARLAGRMDEMLAVALARTGGVHRPSARSWPAVMRLSAQHPELSRLVGVWRTDREGADALIGFAWGCRHGDHAVYSDSASTRQDDIRIAVTYPMLWDLITWARGTGAAWFDLGGVTTGDGAGDDPLAGISDFKRFFTTDLIEVGEEWQLAPLSLSARAAQWAHGTWLRLRGR
jgi:hypothetical protein